MNADQLGMVTGVVGLGSIFGSIALPSPALLILAYLLVGFSTWLLVRDRLSRTVVMVGGFRGDRHRGAGERVPYHRLPGPPARQPERPVGEPAVGHSARPGAVGGVGRRVGRPNAGVGSRERGRQPRAGRGRTRVGHARSSRVDGWSTGPGVRGSTGASDLGGSACLVGSQSGGRRRCVGETPGLTGSQLIGLSSSRSSASWARPIPNGIAQLFPRPHGLVSSVSKQADRQA